MKRSYQINGEQLVVEYIDRPDVNEILDEVILRDVYHIGDLYASGYNVLHCIDVGAYMGFFGKLVHHYWPGAIVVSVEPNFDLIDCIRANGTDHIMQRALRYDGKRDFYVSDHPSGSVIYDPTVNFSEEITRKYQHRTVQTCTFEDMDEYGFTRNQPIDLLKIDCEGSEFDALTGMSEGFRKRIRRIIGEYHHISGFRFVEQIINLRYPHLKAKLLGDDPHCTIGCFEAVESVV